MKRLLIVVSLFILLFHGAAEMVKVEAVEIHERKSNCANVDVEMKSKIKELAEILDQKDLENLKIRINKLLSSIEQLEAEKQITEKALCVGVINDDGSISNKMNVYHSLLVYAIEMKANEDIQFDKIMLEILDNGELLELEAILQDSNKKVHIDYYNYSFPLEAFNEHENRLLEEERPSSLINILTFGLASRTYQVIQNPIEKFIMMVDEFFTGKAELELEVLKNEALIPAMKFGVNFSIITSDISNWEQLYMAEYYPTQRSSNIIERWQSIQKDYPHINFPAEDLLSQNWYEVGQLFSEIKIEYGTDATDYILNGTIGINDRNIEDEELIEALEERELDRIFGK